MTYVLPLFPTLAVDSFNHSLFSCSSLFTYTLMHSHTHALTYSCTHVLTHSCTHSPVHLHRLCLVNFSWWTTVILLDGISCAFLLTPITVHATRDHRLIWISPKSGIPLCTLLSTVSIMRERKHSLLTCSPKHPMTCAKCRQSQYFAICRHRWLPYKPGLTRLLLSISCSSKAQLNGWAFTAYSFCTHGRHSKSRCRACST